MSASDPDQNRKHQSARIARRLNEAFYTAEPGEYFRMRVNAWVALGDSPIELNREEGSLRTEILNRAPSFGLTDHLEERSAFTKVLALESFGLVCHAGESLLRHVFAHFDARGNKSLPWLAMSKLQAGSSFNSRVHEVTQMTDDEIDSIVDTVFLPPEGDFRPSPSPEDLSAHREFLRSWLRHFADYVSSSRNGYNALKHGLAHVPGGVRMSFFADPGEGMDGATREIPLIHGPALRTLEYERQDGRRVWFEVTRGVDIPGLMVCTLVAATLLDWANAIGKGVYLRRSVEVPLALSPMPMEIRKGQSSKWASFRMPIALLPMPTEQSRTIMERLLPLEKRKGDVDQQ